MMGVLRNKTLVKKTLAKSQQLFVDGRQFAPTGRVAFARRVGLTHPTSGWRDANEAPIASLSLHPVDENETICFPASSLARDPDGQSVLVRDVEGTTDVGQQRLSKHLAIYPLQSEFSPGELITLDGTASRDILSDRVTRQWSQVRLSESEPTLTIEAEGTAAPIATIIAPAVACHTTFTVRLAVGDQVHTTFDEVSFVVRAENQGEDCVAEGHTVPETIEYPRVYEACLGAHEVSAETHEVETEFSRVVRQHMFSLLSRRAEVVAACEEMAADGKSSPPAERLVKEIDRNLLAMAEALQRQDITLSSAAVLWIPQAEDRNILGFASLEDTVTWAESGDLVYAFGEVGALPDDLAAGVLVKGSLPIGISEPRASGFAGRGRPSVLSGVHRARCHGRTGWRVCHVVGRG